MLHTPRPASAAKSQIRLYLLGSFRLEREGEPVHLSTRKLESLLAFLALHSEAHSREKVAALLWGNSTDEQARHSLRNALADIRKTLGNVFLAEHDTIQLNANASIWIDAHVFEQETVEDARAAIALYQGDLLQDFYDDWLRPERQRLHTLYLDSFSKLIQQARSESRYGQAIELTHKLLAVDPTNEQGHQHLMFCYAMTGNRAAALKQYDDCVHVLREEFDAEPSSETCTLYKRIKAGQIGTRARAALPTNLPVPLTSFVGRQSEIAEIKRLIAQHRLVTLTGSGGCGKTRLAIEAASQLVETFEHGVWWVELASLSDASLVSQKLAQSLGVGAPTDQMLDETLANFLRDRQVLLMLDNCEHLLSACADLANKLLSACARVKILTTSREALGMMDEMAWRVPSLVLPERLFSLSIDQLLRYDAVRLFAERADSVIPNWGLKEHALTVVHICRRLDGIPLAIELAAARMKVLSIEQVATRLDDRFNLLIGGSRTALPRQQTLRATIDWSYNLLSEAEGTLLRRLSVFAGGWTLEAADRICRGGSMETSEMLNLLTGLVDKSLVLVEAQGGTARYRMLETIRQYAAEKLGELDEVERVKRKHAKFFLEWLELQQSRLRGPEQVATFKQFEIEHDNLRAVLHWARDHGEWQIGMSLAASLAWFWERYGHVNEGGQWLETFLTAAAGQPVPEDLLAKALHGVGTLVQRQNHYILAAQFLERSLEMSKKIDDRLGMGNTLIYLGAGELLTGNFAKAIERFKDSAPLFKDVGNKWGEASSSANLGMTYLFQGDLASARLLLEESLEGLQEAGEEILGGIVLVALGYVRYLQGERGDPEITMRNGLRPVIEGGEKPFLIYCLVTMASVFMTSASPVRAAQLLGISEMLGGLYGVPLPPIFQAVADQTTASAQTQLGPDAFSQAWAVGRAMTLEQAMTLF